MDRIVVIVLAALVSTASCADNSAVKLRRQAEIEFYQIEKLRTSILVKQDTTRATSSNLAGQYADLTNYCRDALEQIDRVTDSADFYDLQNLAFQSGIRNVQIYFGGQRYQECIATTNQLLEIVDENTSQHLVTMLNHGRGLQGAGIWDSALTVYRSVLENYYPPLDDDGNVILSLFNLPSHLHRITMMVGDSVEAAQMLDEAVDYYQKTMAAYPDGKLVAGCHSGLARIYYTAGRWDDVISELEQVHDSTGEATDLIRIRIADIQGSRIGDWTLALSMYESIQNGLEPADSLTLPIVLYKSALAKLELGRYEELRRDLNGLKREHEFFYRTTPAAQYALARSFELEGNWTRAESEFIYLTENYFGSDEAMTAFIHLGDTMAVLNRSDAAEYWYSEAERYYREVASRKVGSPAEARALMFQAELQLHQMNLAEAAELMEQLFNKFPSTETAQRAYIQAARIYREELNQAARADSMMLELRALLQDGNTR